MYAKWVLCITKERQIKLTAYLSFQYENCQVYVYNIFKATVVIDTIFLCEMPS